MDLATYWRVSYRDWRILTPWEFLAMVRPLRFKEGAAVVARWRYEEEQRKKGIVPESDRKRFEASKQHDSDVAELQNFMNKIITQEAEKAEAGKLN